MVQRLSCLFPYLLPQESLAFGPDSSSHSTLCASVALSDLPDSYQKKASRAPTKQGRIQ